MINCSVCFLNLLYTNNSRKILIRFNLKIGYEQLYDVKFSSFITSCTSMSALIYGNVNKMLDDILSLNCFLKYIILEERYKV